MRVWHWLILIGFGAGNEEALCGDAEKLLPRVLLQLDTATQPNSSRSPDQQPAKHIADSDARERLFQRPSVRSLLLILAFMLAHGLFRSWKSIFLLFIPLGLASLPELLAANSQNPGFALVKHCSVAVCMELLTALCVACASEEDAWPFNGFVYRFCTRHLKNQNWPYVVLYLGLGVNIIEAVLVDLASQHTLNALGGLCLIASMPFPGAGIVPYLTRTNDMAAQADLQGVDLSNEDSQALVSDWYVVLRQGRHSLYSDVCCRLPISWIWLYTSWNACFMFDSTMLNHWNLAVLLVPLVESQRILCVQQCSGTESQNAWVNSHWLQARGFSLWLWLAIGGLGNGFFAQSNSIADWFQLTPQDEDEARHRWAFLNLVWGLLHLAWFWHRAYRLSQAQAKRTEECEAKRLSR